MSSPLPCGCRFLTQVSGPEEAFTAEDLSEEQKAVAAMVDQFWASEVEPALPSIRALEPGAARRVLRKAAGLGLMAISIPERYGGLALGLTTSLVIAEHVARDASYMVWEGGHTMLGTLPLLYFGTREQQERYFPKLANLDMLAAYALSEAHAGSDALAVKTRADLNPGGTHYVLNGQKMWITNGSEADLFIVFARVGGEHFTCFLVERRFPGVTTGVNEHKMGLRGSSTTPLYLDEVPVPVENVLGEVGRGHVVAFNILNLGRLKLGASAVGAAKDILQISIRYAKQRRAFGSPIAEFGAIRHKLAEMAIRIFATESIVWRTAGMIEQRSGGIGWEDPDAATVRLGAIREFAVECSIVKVFGSEMLDYVVDEGVQIHGGYGYHEDYAVERAYRDARINRIFEGTNEINRLLIPRMLLKRGIAAEGLPHAAGAGLDRLVSGARAVGRWCLETARRVFAEGLDQEQELLMHLADILIELYAIESVLLRARKMRATGAESDASGIATVFLCDAISRIESSRRHVVLRCNEGGQVGAQLNFIRECASSMEVDTISLRRDIARKLVDHERYVV
jgi:alkylation response protein AidB-like acyl-CoA dehydrogenase